MALGFYSKKGKRVRVMIIYLAGHGHALWEEEEFFQYAKKKGWSYNRLMSPLYKQFTEEVFRLKEETTKKQTKKGKKK